MNYSRIIFNFGFQAAVFMASCMLVGCQRGSMADPNTVDYERICDSHLRQIAVALQMYHMANGRYPPLHLVNSENIPTHSWRVLILPYTDYNERFRGYDFNQSWNSPNNLAVSQNKDFFRPSRLFACPNATLKANEVFDAEHDYGLDLSTNYVMVDYNGKNSYELKDTKNPLHQKTIAIVEIKNTNIHWSQPDDINFFNKTQKIEIINKLMISSNDPNGAIILYSDGTTSRIK